MRPFIPHPWSAGGHRQTLLGYWSRRRLRWTLPAEDILVDVGGDVRLLLRATWQQGPRNERPAVVLTHGLGGCDEAGYVLATARLAFARGWHVVRMNMRGAGDAERLCPRLYNAGLDGDLVAALDAVARLAPRVAAVGFSLGGNVALLALGRSGARLPAGFVAAAAVCPPLDLGACADALERRANRLYQEYFMINLRRTYQRFHTARPDLYASGRERGTRTIREYDEAITAPYGGYRDAEDYYQRSSAGPCLARIDHPALVLAAQDDPLVPADSVTRWALPQSGLVERELLATGGHVGFVGPTEAPGRFWAAERVLDHLDAKARWVKAPGEPAVYSS